MRSSSRLLKNGFLLSNKVVNLEVLDEIATTNEEEATDETNTKTVIDLDEVKEEAKQIYAAAQKKAAHLVEAAENDAVKIRKEAFDKGYLEGRNQSKKENEEILQDRLENFSKALEDLLKTKELLVNEIHEDLLKLLSESIQKICYSFVDDKLVLKVLNEALPLVEECSELVIEVSPEDLAIVQDNQDAILSKCLNVKEFKIVPSDRIERGGFYVTSNTGNIDARLSSRIDSVIKLFKDQNKIADEGVSHE